MLNRDGATDDELLNRPITLINVLNRDGATDDKLLNNGYSAESFQAAKETLKLILA